jgi:hypothetical protein
MLHASVIQASALPFCNKLAMVMMRCGARSNRCLRRTLVYKPVHPWFPPRPDC